MKIKHRIATAYSGLTTNKSRSLLTILGIVIGITAIIIVMAVGQGAENLILGEIQSFGPNSIEIRPGKQPTGPSGFAELFTDSLKSKDLTALTRPGNVQGIEYISPAVMYPSVLSYQDETKRTTIMGLGADFPKIITLDVADGTFVTDEDTNQHSKVLVIGAKVKEDLFGLSDALGQEVRVKDQTFRVIGVLAKKGQSLMDIDNMAIVPYTSAQQYLSGTNYYNSIMLKVKDGQNIKRAVADIEATIRESHNIEDPKNDDFYLATQEDAIKTIGTITSILTILLGAVAGISLLVGGIGIMNIMLVSVSERTKEIGLRKALGATNHDILMQFLFESVMLTAFGGMIGICLGAVISFLTALVLSATVAQGWSFSFPISGALLGLGVSGGIGLIFGIFPARSAARKSPMEALRYE